MLTGNQLTKLDVKAAGCVDLPAVVAVFAERGLLYALRFLYTLNLASPAKFAFYNFAHYRSRWIDFARGVARYFTAALILR